MTGKRPGGPRKRAGTRPAPTAVTATPASASHGAGAVRASTGGTVTVQRTLNVPASAVIRAINDADRRGWAPQPLYRVVSVLAPRFIRLAFPDGSLAAISLARQGNARCTVTVELTKLPAGADERALRERWSQGLAALQEQIDTAWD